MTDESFFQAVSYTHLFLADGFEVALDVRGLRLVAEVLGKLGHREVADLTIGDLPRALFVRLSVRTKHEYPILVLKERDLVLDVHQLLRGLDVGAMFLARLQVGHELIVLKRLALSKLFLAYTDELRAQGRGFSRPLGPLPAPLRRPSPRGSQEQDTNRDEAPFPPLVELQGLSLIHI